MGHHEPILGSVNEQTLPLMGGSAFALRPLQKRVKIGRVASVFTPASVFGKKSSLAEVIQCPLDRGAGELQVCGNGADGWPASAFRICTVFEVDIHGLCPMIQVGLIYVRKIGHSRHLSGPDFTRFV